MIRSISQASLALALALASGCTFGPLGSGGDESEPTANEDAIGVFDVVLERESSSCGTGTLGLTEGWGFTITLGRQEDGAGIVWDLGGGDHVAELGEDGTSFRLATVAVIDMREGETSMFLPPCSVERTDALEAKLDDREAPTAFAGAMVYAFKPTEGSDCSDLLLGEDRVAARLPCVASYDLSAALRSDPNAEAK